MFVVIAYRWGSNENHSYTVGVFSTVEKATDCAEKEANYRGGKYACVVEKCKLDFYNDDSSDLINEVYRAKSRRG